MKRYIISALLLAALGACQDKDGPSPNVDPFVGAWSIDRQTLTISYPDVDLNVSFKIAEADGGLSFHDINIEYPEVPGSLSYHAEAFGRFAVNAGYDSIRLSGNDNQQSIAIVMKRSIVHLKTSDVMDVYIMEIRVTNRDPLILQSQVFTRN